MLILGHMAWTEIRCIPIIPIVTHFSNSTPLGIHYSTRSKHVGKWRDRGREKHCLVLPVFFFVNEHSNTNKKPQATITKETIFRVIPEEKQQLVEENDADIESTW